MGVLASKIIAMDWLLIVGLAHIAIAFVAGKVAQDRGYSFRAYFILSLFLPLIGLLVALTRPEE